MLFFDETDALFGKRSAVNEGHDRYANIELLVANLDDAFARRIDVRVVFAHPEAPERRRLSARHLPPSLPLGEDVDLDFLATAFRLAGGDIRNVTRAAPYAAHRGEPVGMAHFVRATARECRKLGGSAPRKTSARTSGWSLAETLGKLAAGVKYFARNSLRDRPGRPPTPLEPENQDG